MFLAKLVGEGADDNTRGRVYSPNREESARRVLVSGVDMVEFWFLVV